MCETIKADLPAWMDEFERQVANLLAMGYPALCRQTNESFAAHADALRAHLPHLRVRKKTGNVPFVIVVKQEWAPLELVMPKVNVNGKSGTVDMTPVLPSDFRPIAGQESPAGGLYLLEDVDTGRETLNITPEKALKAILAAGRLPLTIDEGVSFVAHYPQILTDKRVFNCIQMPGSRRSDQRIPSLWISHNRPRLGWCWDRNPHTWLGSASCSRRLGVKP
ncbi:MAG: hypothetical protein H3C50_10790 [Kiritimatiellae bacterium]|nr:hypothetical protein [Kiritimatiellia bacterium]MCO5067077.1 DUF5701 family protein [Kiritimatiellia bacterium]